MAGLGASSRGIIATGHIIESELFGGHGPNAEVALVAGLCGSPRPPDLRSKVEAFRVAGQPPRGGRLCGVDGGFGDAAPGSASPHGSRAG
jgi:hypothetical protein